MAVTPNYGWPVPVATDYVKDGWEAIADLGDAIDTTVAGLNTGVETVLSSGSFTTTGALNLTNVLSDTYKFYNLYFYALGSTSTNINLRYRENTTDLTTGYYGGGNYGQYNGATGNWFNSSNASLFGMCGVNTTITSSINMRITRFNATEGTISYLVYDNTTDAGAHFSGINGGMTNFSGLTIYPTSGTMTGYYILTGISA